MKNESGLEFFISNAGVESDRNYTCIPFNKVSAALRLPLPNNTEQKIQKLQHCVFSYSFDDDLLLGWEGTWFICKCSCDNQTCICENADSKFWCSN